MADGGITVALVSAGIICLIAGVIGGGLKGLGFDMPALQSLPRQVLLGGLGVALLAAGLVLRPSDGPAKPADKPNAASPAAEAVEKPAEPVEAATDAPKARPPGSESAWREAQTMLQKLGYYDGPDDGIAGARAADALRRFQKEAGLPVDGVPGPTAILMLRQRVAARP